MKLIRALYRTIALLLYLSFLTPFVLLFGNIKARGKNSTLGPIVVNRVCQLYLRVLNVDVSVDKPHLLENFEGFIFSNHTSYMDIITGFSVVPVRFVAKDGVKKMPFIGKIATAIGCVYVKRQERNSRKEARQALQGMDRYYPPVVLYPEGRTAPVGHLLPFRRGAFEIAQSSSIPYVLVAITYSLPRLVDWRSRSFNDAAWAILSRKERLYVKLYVIDQQSPTPNDDPDDLRQDAESKMLSALVGYGNYAPEIFDGEWRTHHQMVAAKK
ncbi:MAG: lysophospholipid acyltransferase family protein [Chloroflexota bacterium]